MRSTWLTLATCAACGFGGSDGPSDGPPPGEKETVLDSLGDFNDGSPVVANVTVTEAGTIEPKAWLPGLLLAEISGNNVNFGTWAMKPTRAQMLNVGIMAPPFDGNQRPPGVVGSDYTLWFSGEVKLDAGAQKLALSTAANATTFAEILNSDGAVLATCNQSTQCNVTAPAAGWYVLHMGWRHPINAPNNSFELQWATGAGPLLPIGTERLRVATHEPAMAGWLVEGHEFQRSISHLNHGTALNYEEPFSLTWRPGLLGLDGDGASPSYRNAGQLRILDGGDYDFTVTAQSEAAYRLWIDGEWMTKASAWDPQPSGVKTEKVTAALAPGWHDVVLEGYEQAGTSNSVSFTYGKSGQAAIAPAPLQARPLLSPTTQLTTGTNFNTLQLEKGVTVSEALTVSTVVNAPAATAIDVWLRLTPKVWAGLDVKLKPPGATAAIPLSISTDGLIDDATGDVHASLPMARLGNAPVSGNWTIEVTHPDAGDNLGSSNTLSRARLTVHYKGAPTVGTPIKQIAETGRYVRALSLDKPRELRGIVVTGAQPQGATIAASLQTCSDAAATSCDAPLTAAQLAEQKPTAQHVKLTVDFTSDGHASPILDKLALRYKE